LAEAQAAHRPSKPESTTASSLEVPENPIINPPQELSIKDTKITVSKGPQKVPFSFARSPEKPQGGLPPPIIPSGWLITRANQLMSGLRFNYLLWFFSPCIEEKSAADLPHIHLVVTAVQGKSPESPI
jgi:hypothetical protein